MATTAAHFLAFLALVINTALMLPCACCLGVEVKADSCCAIHPETVVESASCCSSGCCSTTQEQTQHHSTEISSSSSLPCLDGNPTAICCCNDAHTAAVTTISNHVDHDLYSIDNAPVVPLVLTSLLDITITSAWPDLPVERSLISSHSPCALLQLLCAWLK